MEAQRRCDYTSSEECLSRTDVVQSFLHLQEVSEERMSKETRPEDEWFARHEEELLRQAQRERQRQGKAENAAPPQCPRCSNELKEEDIVGVTIDRCVDCQGIFLDRGELEEILLQSGQERRGFFRKLLGFGD